jgi:hypothetical protein
LVSEQQFANPERTENSGRISFREVQKLVVERWEDAFNRVSSSAGANDYHRHIQPHIFVVQLLLQPSATAGNWFFFKEEEAAQRMAKAMVHAVELCGGGDKDPFK